MLMISVIMSVYNGMNTVGIAIDSILKQTYQNFEMIICDDNSADNTYQILCKYAEKDSRIKVIQNDDNKGLAFSLNRCIKLAKGDYIARMDDDDISHIDRFEKQIEFASKHPEYTIIGTGRNTFDFLGVWEVSPGVGRELKSNDIISGLIFTHPTVLIKKDDLIKVGGYTVSKRTMRGQDLDLWCKFYASGYRGYVMNDILFDYFENRNKIKEKSFKTRYYNFLTHIKWRKRMGLSLWYDRYAYKELVAAILPTKVLVYLKNRKRNKR